MPGRSFQSVDTPGLGRDFNDLYQFDINTSEWTNLSDLAFGEAPSPRNSFGFTSSGRKLYVFGGLSSETCGWRLFVAPAGSLLAFVLCAAFCTLAWQAHLLGLVVNV